MMTVHVVETGNEIAAALHDAVRTRVGEQHAHAAVTVGDQENFRARWIHFHDLADNSVGDDDAHILSDVVLFPAVDVNGLRGGIGAGIDDPGRQQLGLRMGFAKVQEHAQALRFRRLALELSIAEL
jgi:hypothetical protein